MQRFNCKHVPMKFEIINKTFSFLFSFFIFFFLLFQCKPTTAAQIIALRTCNVCFICVLYFFVIIYCKFARVNVPDEISRFNQENEIWKKRIQTIKQLKKRKKCKLLIACQHPGNIHVSRRQIENWEQMHSMRPTRGKKRKNRERERERKMSMCRTGQRVSKNDGVIMGADCSRRILCYPNFRSLLCTVFFSLFSRFQMEKYGLSTIFHHSCLNVKTKQKENTVYLIVEILLYSLCTRARLHAIRVSLFFPYFFFLFSFSFVFLTRDDE